MRLIFMGTAPFACPTLRALLASSHAVLGVVTQPDRPRGRGRHAAPSAVKILALEHHLRVLQPVSLRPPEVAEELSAFQPEVIVVAAYGNILPPVVLRLPPYGCVNLHASLLPKYRGPAPINWTLIHGEKETGFTIIQMDEHVDTGPILWRESCAVQPDDDALSLGERLAETGAVAMVKALSALERGEITARPQPEAGASSAPKLTRELGRIDWHQPAEALHNLIRGLVPWPGATATLRDLELKIWRSAWQPTAHDQAPGTVTAVTAEGLWITCGKDQLVVKQLQPANRRRMPARDFAQGYRVHQGDRFA